MAVKLLIVFLLVSYVSAQTYRVCIAPNQQLCQNLDKDGSRVTCSNSESRVDCALSLARNEADIGVFTGEELLLLAAQQPNDHRVVATIRDATKTDPYSFEAVVVVRSSHDTGLEGLRGGGYCHPGLDDTVLRWSPRVLKAFEQAAARTDRCPDSPPDHKTAEELEVEVLNSFFGPSCRPGSWSANTTVDAYLKRTYPQLCSLCDSTCSGYNLDMGVSVNGVNNDNAHIRALECLRRNGTVSYVAWQHVREQFTSRYPQEVSSYALLCPDGSRVTLTAEIVSGVNAPCAFIRQPWPAIVTTASRAEALQVELAQWWPSGANPGGNTWQSVLFGAIVGGANERVFTENATTPAQFTAPIRTVPAADASTSCVPARRWCTINALEQTKCQWTRAAAHSLGLQPAITCLQRANMFDCLKDIKDGNADFIAASSNYGYLARQHYSLSGIKLLQNANSNPNAFSRVAAFIKETHTNEITRFENLRGKRACFPEFGGIAYMSFVRAAQENGVLSKTECDYARAVGELFDGACAPGALDASHALSESSFDSSVLCTACRPTVNATVTQNNFTCAWDYGSNLYFGNNGTLACLADTNTHVAFVDTKNINSYLTSLNLQASQFRALCRNNTLAASTGVAIDNNCLLAYTVDSEVLTRRNDPLNNALSTLLDALDITFGYTAAASLQLINLEIYSPFDRVENLLFKNTAIGLTEPSAQTSHEPAKNYFELFSHLEGCTNAAPAPPNVASKHVFSLLSLVVVAFAYKFQF